MRTLVLWIGLSLLLFMLVPTPARADMLEPEDEEFETFHVGVRGGVWESFLELDAQINGEKLAGGTLTSVFGDDIDFIETFGIEAEAQIFFAELFIESRFISLYAQATNEFTYESTKTLERSVSFGGLVFEASTTVETTLRNQTADVRLALNPINGESFRLSTIIGARLLALDWEVEVKAQAPPPAVLKIGAKADTSNIDAPTKYNDFQILPIPSLGVGAAIRITDFLEVAGYFLMAGTFGMEYAGLSVDYYDAELTATLYPIDNIGIQIGGRYLSIKGRGTGDVIGVDFDIDLSITGFTGALILRF